MRHEPIPFSRKGLNERGGYVLILVAFSFIAFFSIGALAIDGARIYLASVAMGKAVREAGLTVLARRADDGFKTTYGGAPEWTDGTNLGVGKPLPSGHGTKYRDLACVGYQAVYGNMSAAGFTVTEGFQSAGKFNFNLCKTASTAPPASNPTFLTYTDEATVDGYVDGVRYLSYNSATNQEELSINARYKVDTFLWGKIPFLPGCSGGICDVGASTTIKMDPVYITLVLDVSGSMRCNITDNSPFCSQPLVAGNSKLDKLKDAVKIFIESFNPFKDYIGIVPFNILADPNSLSFRDTALGILRPYGASQPRYNSLINYVDGLVPQSATNPCDGLVKAAEILDPVPNVWRDKGNSFVVFFTDGAPNAGVYNFFSPPPPGLPPVVGGPTPNLYSPTGVGGIPIFDDTTTFLMYEVTWNGVDLSYNSPSVLIEKNGSMYGFSPNNTGPPAVPNSYNSLFPAVYGPPASANPGPTPVGVRVCGDESAVPYPAPANVGVPFSRGAADRSKFDRFLNKDAASLSVPPPAVPGKGCLKNHVGFRVRIGTAYTGAVGTDIPLYTAGAAAPPPDYDVIASAPPVPGVSGNTQPAQAEEMPFLCAIQAADYIRSARKATIYAIGLGLDQDNFSAGAGGKDPAENMSDAFRRHDGFISMLANDTTRIIREGMTGFDGRRNITIPLVPQNANHSRKGKTFHTGSNGIAPRNSAVRRGAYFPADSALQLKGYFGKISHEILMRVGS